MWSHRNPYKNNIQNKLENNSLKWWKYCKQTNNKKLQNMKVLQIDQQKTLHNMKVL
jgi:hypothetical protein